MVLALAAGAGVTAWAQGPHGGGHGRHMHAMHSMHGMHGGGGMFMGSPERITQAMLEASAVLTPEQRVKLGERMAERKQRMEERRKRMHERHERMKQERSQAPAQPKQ